MSPESYPERLLRTLNNPGRQTAQIVAFAWVDTKKSRFPGSRACAILKDSDESVPEAVLTAVKAYDVTPVSWSHREDLREELAA